jgi:hypothetical protein
MANTKLFLVQCPFWVNRCGSILPSNSPMSVVDPIASRAVQCSETTLCAIGDFAPLFRNEGGLQQKAARVLLAPAFK